jgi:hypothetical protein
MIGVVYIARGKDPNWSERFIRFRNSYLQNPAGADHQVYVIFKEFDTPDDFRVAQDILRPLRAHELAAHIDNNALALPGIIFEHRHLIAEQDVFLLNSSSHIMYADWLKMLVDNYRLPTVGLVGCTGSFGFITEFFPNLTYPNVHVRDTAILVNKDFYCDVATYHLAKGGARGGTLAFEHGPDSLTRQVMAAGKTVLVVEKDGRGRAPHEWPHDTTYRGNQQNVLILDRGSRDYQDL